MPKHRAEAEWRGTLPQGTGQIVLGSGAFAGPYSFKSRFEEGHAATNPEELIGAAHAGCFDMSLAAALTRAGFTATRIQTVATVTLEKTGDSFAITEIALGTRAEVPGIDDGTFQKALAAAKERCPISRALAGTRINLTARLL